MSLKRGCVLFKRILTTGNMSGDGDKFCNAAELFNIAEKNNENQ